MRLAIPFAGYWNEIASLIGLFFGPIMAVWITLWHQDRSQKRQARWELFITLMAHRKSVASHPDRSNALNLIDVVYADDAKVVALWHSLFQILGQKPEELNAEAKREAYIALLVQMAQSLGYKRLQKTDIDNFYVPQDAGDNAILQAKLARELLRVLENTASLSATPKPINQPPIPVSTSMENPTSQVMTTKSG